MPYPEAEDPNRPVTETELDKGIQHAQERFGRTIKREGLRLLVNETLQRRKRDRKLDVLAFLRALLWEKIPRSSEDWQPKRQAYKEAILCILASRPTYEPVKENELDIGIRHARQKFERDVDREKLRDIVNTSLERREPGSRVAFLVATVVRDKVPRTSDLLEREAKVDAYTGAAMKIFSDRSLERRRANARKEAQGIEVPPTPPQVRHPEDPESEGQFILFPFR